MKLNDEFVGEFVEFCESRGTDPKEAIEILNSQEWDKDEEFGTMAATVIHEAFI